VTHDVLAPFRRPGSTPATSPAAQRDRELAGYRAYGVASGPARPLRLDIRPKDGLAVARLYSALTEIAYDRTGYSGILLVFTGKLVKLRGRNLRPVVEALLAGTCEYVAELGDGEQAKDGEPVIDRIEGVATPARPSAGEKP
jgi:hypothetical protein